ncbi:crotonase/enoyl-CoA hydratase family protein [Niveispirillum sp. BGYR6]|uniref:crotonase/enoyl-CoA hydratase family protein n=1 Tax=Niveispirillum sp. BGYR6 TaxID=2971249 RepID=UPI0022B9C1DC|nr:crotonase/enoyl-CoA hydratase family protein [Niveispirillum sp. BGYR6]MDG5493285.1 crotonase/enoyl-CoA hydratase family protein [Niveispirillum sp. BGYR6]
MNYETIRYDVTDSIATITLNRPDRMNAYNPKMAHELVDAFDHVDVNDTVRAVIVTGAGRAFCAGADLEGGTSTFDFAGRDDSPVRADGSLDYARPSARDMGGLVSLRVYRCLKPVIGAFNGAAVGIGATMLLPADVLLAAEEARFGFVFARRGIVPEAASAYFLPRLVGISQALEWCYSGHLVPAEEALSAGLVRQVVPAADLLPTAHALAHQLTAHSAPVSVAMIRQMMWRGLGYTDPMQAHRIDSRAILSRGRSGDAAEGVASFLEKRPASFPDKVSRDMPDFFPWWEELSYE